MRLFLQLSVLKVGLQESLRKQIAVWLEFALAGAGRFFLKGAYRFPAHLAFFLL